MVRVFLLRAWIKGIFSYVIFIHLALSFTHENGTLLFWTIRNNKDGNNHNFDSRGSFCDCVGFMFSFSCHTGVDGRRLGSMIVSRLSGVGSGIQNVRISVHDRMPGEEFPYSFSPPARSCNFLGLGPASTAYFCVFLYASSYSMWRTSVLPGGSSYVSAHSIGSGWVWRNLSYHLYWRWFVRYQIKSHPIS